MKLGVIGSGSVVPFHLDALVSVGFKITSIASRPGSVTTHKLAERYSAIPLNNFHEVSKSDIDAVLIAPASDAIEHVLKHFLKLDIPILVEKPVIKSADRFKELGDLENQNVLVGYNRRFYGSVQELKSTIRLVQPHSFLFKVPENSWNGNLDLAAKKKYLFDNTVHMIDLLRYLLGNVSLKLSCNQGYHKDKLSVINVCVEGDEISGILQITFDSPGSYHVEFNGGGLSLILEPIENLKTYDAIEVIDPTIEHPTRRYSPKLSNSQFQISEFDLRFKAGFYEQSKAFASLVNGKRSTIAANLYDAYKAVEFMEQISGLKE